MADIVYDAVLGGTTVRQVTRSSFEESIQLVAGRYSGGVDPQDHFVDNGDPRATFDTMDLAGLLSVSNILSRGLAITAGTVVIPWQKRANGSTFDAGNEHFTISGANALIVPQQISASQNGGGATLSCQVIFYSRNDGFTRPYNINVNQALSSQAFNAMFDLGPAAVNGTAVPKLTGTTVNTGLSVNGYRHNGGVWFDDVFIEQVDPTIEVTARDFDRLADFVGGLAINGSGVSVWFRKKLTGSTYVDPANTNHIRASFAAGMIQNTTLSADGVTPGVGTVRFTGRALAISTAAAIA